VALQGWAAARRSVGRSAPCHNAIPPGAHRGPRRGTRGRIGHRVLGLFRPARED